MSLIISKNGKNAKRVNRTGFENEDELQRYIEENPESIPLYDIKEDIRLLVAAREFPTQSGPIDAVGIDKDGELYLVETKLYRNTDKRNVVAQVLDYGASLWKHSSEDWEGFRAELERQSQEKWKIGLQEKLQNFFGIADVETLALLDSVAVNLNAGRFKFVVLMDTLHDQLKDLILFINQNSKFSIFIAEMEYYKHEEYEILIPRLYGAEVKKDISVRTSSRRSVTLEELAEQFTDEEGRRMFMDFRKALLQLSPFIREKINPTGISFWFNGHLLCDAYPYWDEPFMRVYFRNDLIRREKIGKIEVSEGKNKSNLLCRSKKDATVLVNLAKDAIAMFSGSADIPSTPKKGSGGAPLG